ncbi:YgjV family protein [Aliidiomarina celeris]|uniref:YgjV family protein n=1 Tax=Aliidiomarina celeris TaxID=2249428 RepID=UPI000DEA5414|nr:YgjV family protein [Aliidiomarina celeris]
MEIWITVTGLLALVTNFIAYRAESANTYRLIAALALAFLSSHFFMQGALAGGIALGIGAVRNIVAMKYTQKRILFGFVAVNIGFCLWEWLYLGNSAILFIAYASALIFTVGTIVLTNATAIRRWFILAELLGLIYAAFIGSTFGVLFNLSNLVSIVLKLLSDKRTRKQQDATTTTAQEGTK